MWTKRSKLSLYLVICLTIYLLQLSLICSSLRVKSGSNLLEPIFVEVTNLIANAESFLDPWT